MQQVYSSVIQFHGSHYDFGIYQGEQLQQTNFLNNKAGMKEQLLKKFSVPVSHIQALLTQFAPHLLDEIAGLAHSLHMSLEDAFILFGGYYSNTRSGCSIFMQEQFFVRNYDQEPSTYDGRYVLFHPTDGGFASIGPSMQITGRTDGMNEFGLVIGYNFVNSRQHEDGFVCNMIARIVLESCQTTEQAILLLSQIPHKHSFNYCLLDAKGHFKIVEASPRGIELFESYACTNHFRVQTKENRYTMADSLAREASILQLANEQPNFTNGYQLLNDTEAGIFAKKYSAWDGTIHTATYMPEQLQATITLGGNRAPLPFDFSAWLQHHTLHITKIKGQLDAKKGFASQ